MIRSWPAAALHFALFTLLAGTAYAVLPDRAWNRPVQTLEDGYASSQVCQSCHPGEYATWHDSYHRTMTQVATPESAIAPFEDVTLSLYGDTYEMGVDRGKLRVLHRFEDGGELRTKEKEIVLSTGSHHFQAYWVATGDARKISLFPMAFHIAEKRWIPFDTIMMAPHVAAYRQANADGGQWNRRCIRCHSTGYQPRSMRPEGMDTRVAEFGIACEACHGPGAEHVAANRNPIRRYGLHLTGNADPTMVQPARLDHRLASQVCGQCHSTREDYRGEKLVEWAESGSFYRAGENLHATRRIIHGDGPQHPERDLQTRFWPDGEVRVGGREYNSMLRSGCFKRGEITCMSCHVLHQKTEDPRPVREWANDQLAPGMDGSKACIGCHPQFQAAEQITAHTHHAADSSGSDCLNCHMPYGAWGLQKATRSHEIDSPSTAESTEFGRPNACNQCHLDETLAWTATHMEQWYGQAPPEDLPTDGVSQAVKWLVAGDAGQRGLIAWSMGWEPAQRASGKSWMVPYLSLALGDSYGVNRYVALRSLRTHPGFENFQFDYTADYTGNAAAIDEGVVRAVGIFARNKPATPRADAEALLIGPDGGLKRAPYEALEAQRNERAVYLLE